MVAKNRKNGKIVHIDYSFDFNIPGPTTIYERKKIVHRRNIEAAEIILKERNAEIEDLEDEAECTASCSAEAIEDRKFRKLFEQSITGNRRWDKQLLWCLSVQG